MGEQMTDRFLFGLTLISALGCGLVAGVFFAFSNFVMKGLARLPAAQGIAAMNSINVTVINPAFMTALFGTAACCAVLVVSALRSWDRPDAVYLLAGGVIHVVGNAVVTMVFNVPRNNALAAVDPLSAEGAMVWAKFLQGWTAWNHVRTVTGLVAAASLTIGLTKF